MPACCFRNGLRESSSAVGIVEAEGPVDVIAAGLGENLDAAETEAVVFRRERILVDADFADGFLGGKLAAAEAIDIDLSAVGTGAGPGERLQRVSQIVGIVGQRGEIFAFDHQRGGVVIGLDAHGDGGFALHFDGGFFRLDGQLEGRGCGLSGRDRDRRVNRD